MHVYDSLYETIPISLVESFTALLHSSAKLLTFRNLKVHKQSNYSDYGVFVIAMATALCNGNDPTTITRNTSKLRHHLKNCLEGSRMEPFPNIKNVLNQSNVIR